MRLFTFENGDDLHLYQKSLVVCFKGKRAVLSTSLLNGGYTENLTHVFNHDGKEGAGMPYTLKAPTYQEHLRVIAEELGLNAATTSGLTTAADMENASIKTQHYNGIHVAAVVTGGVDINGGRVGDEATWDESEETSPQSATLGTINILLFIDANLPKGTLARVIVTATEAKTAMLQELLAQSRYSMGLATGTGTDGIIVVANPSSPLTLTNAGKHSKLGQLIAACVKDALEETLCKQTNLTKQSQHNVLRRMQRFGVTQNSLFHSYKKNGGTLEKPQFIGHLETFSAQSKPLVYSSLYAHLLDQLMWQLLTPAETLAAGETLLSLLCTVSWPCTLPSLTTVEDTLKYMIDRYHAAIISALLDGEILE